MLADCRTFGRIRPKAGDLPSIEPAAPDAATAGENQALECPTIGSGTPRPVVALVSVAVALRQEVGDGFESGDGLRAGGREPCRSRTSIVAPGMRSARSSEVAADVFEVELADQHQRQHRYRLQCDPRPTAARPLRRDRRRRAPTVHRQEHLRGLPVTRPSGPTARRATSTPPSGSPRRGRRPPRRRLQCEAELPVRLGPLVGAGGSGQAEPTGRAGAPGRGGPGSGRAPGARPSSNPPRRPAPRPRGGPARRGRRPRGTGPRRVRVVSPNPRWSLVEGGVPVPRLQGLDHRPPRTAVVPPRVDQHHREGPSLDS